MVVCLTGTGAGGRAAAGLKSIMAMIALYESALYIFVFLWTPALESRAEAVGIASIPHGIIFSLFMVPPSTLLIAHTRTHAVSLVGS